MKKLNLIALVACCLAAVTFTSCNDDNDYKGLTPQEKAQAFNVVKGTYVGDLIYPAENPTNKSDVTDTLTVKWDIQSDTVMVIRNFPMNLLANNITNKDLANALKTQQPRDLKCYIDFSGVSPVSFFINPTLQSFTLDYGGKNHVVQIAMLGNNIYSFGAYDSTKKLLQMQIVEAGIYVNGILQKGTLASAVPFIFKATK